MSKKGLLLLTVTLVLVLACGLVVRAVLTGRQSTQKSANEGIFSSLKRSTAFSPTPKIEKRKTYQDTAGFVFQYLDSLVVREVETQDPDSYSFLEIYAVDRPGEKMTFQVTDTNFSTADEWLSQNRKEGWLVKETVFGMMNGRAISTSKNLLSVAVSKGILFLLESPKDTGDYWQKQQEIIRGSLKVDWPSETTEVSQEQPGSSGVEEEAEEVIE